jgi:hypothetical protein
MKHTKNHLLKVWIALLLVMTFALTSGIQHALAAIAWSG